MKTKIFAVVMILALFAGFAFGPTGVVKAQSGVSVPVVGSAAGGNTFSGVYNITSFAKQGSTLYAVGTLAGTLTNALGQTVGTVSGVPVRVPVAGAGVDPSCTVLTLLLML